MRSVFKIRERDGRKSADYHGKIKLGPGSQRRVKLFTDRTASERELVKLQKEADQRTSGVINSDSQRAGKPLPVLVEEYFSYLATQSSNREHMRISRWMLDRLIELGQWKFFRDITLPSMTLILSKLEGENATASYRNKFIVRAKAFVKWVLPDDMVNPLAKLKRIKEKGARRTRERRAASADQLHKLFSLSLPFARRIAYALAAYNGLRRNEVAALTWGRLHLEAPIPFVSLPQKQGSDDSEDSIPIHPYVLKLLKGKGSADESLKLVQAVPDPATLEKDWGRAGVAYVDDKSRRIDFHGLRHTFQTLLDRTGCSRATKKRLMRHAASDVTDGYAHAELTEMLAALSRLESPSAGAVVAAAAKTTTAKVAPVGPNFADHSSDQLMAMLGHYKAVIGRLSELAKTPCSIPPSGYNPASVNELQSAAGMDSQNAHNSFSDNNLRPSTQVD